MNRPYAPPSHVSDPRPRVIFWFRVYAAVMLLSSLVALGCALFYAMCFPLPLVAAAAASAALHAGGVVVPFKPWGWTLGLIVIALGIPGPMIVVCGPLMVGWMKPMVKAAFCRL